MNIKFRKGISSYMINRKLLLALVAVLLIVLLAACGGGSKSGGDSAEPSTSQNGTTTETGDTEEGPPDPVTFTYFNAGASRKDVETKDTMIGKVYYDATGVNWRIEHLVGEVQTRIGTMIAGGQYPDVVVPDTEIDKMVDAGAFIDLKPLIEEHAPNIKRVYEPYYNLMEDDQGRIFFLPFSPLVGEYIPSPVIDQGAFWIQRRVLKEFNYPKIKTLDEYFDLIRQYIAKYPNEDLIGFTILTDDWRFFVLTNPANHLAGYPNDGAVMVDMETLEATDYGASEYMKRWLKALNELNAEGLLDQASFTNNYDQYLARLVSGKVLGYFDYGWQVNQANMSLQQAGNDDLEYFPLPIVFDHDIKDQYIDPPSFVNNRGIGITVSAQDPVRIIKFWDFMLEEENQIMNQWGIEGVTYEVDENGRLYRTPEQIEALRDQEYQQEVGLTYFSYYWPMYSPESKLPDGNAVAPGRQPEVAQMSFTEGDREILSKYGVQTFAELFSPPDDRPWYPAWSISLETGSPAQLFEQRRDDLQREYFPRIILASPEEFESVWNEYETLYNQLDVELYEQTMTELIRAKVEAVTGN